MYKLTKIFEQFWLVFSIASALVAFYMIVRDGWVEGVRYFIVPVIAFFWYLFRRGMRKRMERNMSDNSNK